MREITPRNYKTDKHYPAGVRAVESILARSDVVAPVEVFLAMGNLSREHYEAWRRGQVPYLERVIQANLEKASRILRILAFHAHDLNLVPSYGDYRRWGKGKSTLLRFSKYGVPALEQAYSRHYLRKRLPAEGEAIGSETG